MHHHLSPGAVHQSHFISWNLRKIEWLRLEGTSGSHLIQPPCSSKVTCSQLPSIQTAFEYLQGWRLHNLPGQPMPVLIHSHSEKALPDIQRECLLPQVLTLGTTGKSLAPSFLHPPFRYLYTLVTFNANPGITAET